MLSIHDTLGSIPSTKKKKNKIELMLGAVLCIFMIPEKKW